MKTGDQAPDFRLQDDSESWIQLTDLKGKWVILYFYPRDNTPGCTTEALEFTALANEFSSLEAVVLGVSPDSCSSHAKFVLKYDLGIRLLADPGKTVCKAYGAWGEKKLYGKLRPGVIRSTVLIDPHGRIAHHWPKVKARGHAAEVLELLRGRIDTQ